jgi:hypothetical protein
MYWKYSLHNYIYKKKLSSVTRCQIYASCTADSTLFHSNFQKSCQGRFYLNFWLISYHFQATPVNRRLIVSLSAGANKEMRSSFHVVNGFQISTDHTQTNPTRSYTMCVKQWGSWNRKRQVQDAGRRTIVVKTRQATDNTSVCVCVFFKWRLIQSFQRMRHTIRLFLVVDIN